MQFKNTKNIPYYVFGEGSILALPELLSKLKGFEKGAVVYCVDHFFKGRDLVSQLSIRKQDSVFYIDTTDEPKTTDIDFLVEQLKGVVPVCLVGLGGGAALDVTKAFANLITNGGKAEDYQGWDLVKKPAVYKIGIPTLSGTGSESSRTCVLTNEKRKIKLGMNSDFSMFDQLILDPDLTKSVPRDQYFYSGLDTYFHCIESLLGSYRNVIVDALSEKAVDLCQEIFLSDDMMSPSNRAKMMIASYLGGCAAGNVGLIHPVSAGLSVVLHTHHGIANCLAMNALEEFYPIQFKEYIEMQKKQNVPVPRGVCADLDHDIYENLYASSIMHEKPLANALGTDFKRILTKDKMISIFKGI